MSARVFSSNCFAIVDLAPLGLDLNELRARAEAAYEEKGRAYYAEPTTVIAKVGLEKTIQDVDWNEPWVREKILDRIVLPQGEAFCTLYRLPPHGGISPIHVDTESCNILLPLHDTHGLAEVRWFEWPEIDRVLTEDDWRLYGEDWEKYPICDFADDLSEVARHTWRQGEAILLNTRQPHSSVNNSDAWRINLVINFYGTPFAQVAELAAKGMLFSLHHG